MQKHKIIVVDDHEVFRIGMKMLLNMIDNIKVVGEASNGEEFLELLKKEKPDLVFMDVNMPILDGIAATESAMKKYPELKIIALTTFGDTATFDKMIYAGVEGYMLKSSDFNDFKNAIDKVFMGGNYFSDELLINFTKSNIKSQIKAKDEIQDITKRELDVLKLICKGYSNIQIGEELFISDRTVERYKTKLIEKTNSANTINLVLFAIKNKLVTIE